MSSLKSTTSQNNGRVFIGTCKWWGLPIQFVVSGFASPMASLFRNKPFPFAISTSLILTAITFAALNDLPHMQIIPCTDTWADNLVLTLALVSVLQIFFAPKILPGHYRFFLASHAIVILFTLWLGLYPVSPLGYSTGRIPNLRGFLIIRTNRTSAVANREIVSVSQGSAVAISPLTLPGEFHCDWMSTAGGELDDPSSCDTVYIPPTAIYDILRLRIQSTCGLPDSTGQIRISILP